MKIIEEIINNTIKAEGSGVESPSGARIGEVKRKVKNETADELMDGLLLIQGGGNTLENVGTGHGEGGGRDSETGVGQ